VYVVIRCADQFKSFHWATVALEKTWALE